jgi:ketosteroid isomerase-like protein
MLRRLYPFILICTWSLAGQGQTPPDSTEVVQAINTFIDAFSNLKWEKFSDCWAEDATAFFPPSARFPYRAGNKQEILQIFKTVFEKARIRKTSPPYIIIQPLDRRVQMAGTTAIVTFTLDDPDLLGRRTLVLKKEDGKWLIIHLHASGVTVEN